MPNALDLLIVAALAAAFAGGWQLGFVTRATSWLGLAVGLILGARSLPWIVDRLEGASSGRMFITLGVVLLALGSVGLLIGLVIGNRLREVMSGYHVHPVDRFAGGLASCAGVLAVVWLLVPVMADVRQWPAQQARGSTIARALDSILPEPPDSIQALGRVVGEDQFPRVLDALQPTPSLVEPPPASGLTDELAARVSQSIVRVEGVACRRIQVGSGFVVGGELVLTNAHVIAGEPATIVRRDDGTELDATVVLFDPGRDLAVLSVPGIDRPGLELRSGSVGDTGGVFGHPNGGDMRIAPFEVARHLTATGRDIYNDRRISRDVYFIASDLASGDSGAALVAPDGTVVGMAFAVAPDRDAVAYALTADEVTSALDAPLSEPVDTGDCLL
jgi:uncharacterized membrane protein required for colicin V production